LEDHSPFESYVSPESLKKIIISKRGSNTAEDIESFVLQINNKLFALRIYGKNDFRRSYKNGIEQIHGRILNQFLQRVFNRRLGLFEFRAEEPFSGSRNKESEYHDHG
jgi:hypothetical protein